VATPKAMTEDIHSDPKGNQIYSTQWTETSK